MTTWTKWRKCAYLVGDGEHRQITFIYVRLLLELGSLPLPYRAVGRSENLGGACKYTRSFDGTGFATKLTKIWRGSCTLDPASPDPTALLSAWLSAIAGSFGSGLKKRELKKEERKKGQETNRPC